MKSRSQSPGQSKRPSPIPIERFARTPAWRSLPFRIQLALLHLVRAEQEGVVN